MDIRDKEALYKIKQKLGGSIYIVSKANALKYQLSGSKNLIVLINMINGLIRNSVRLMQMNKLYAKYGIVSLKPKPLNFNNG
jgi:glycerol-3-phosphate responsive antiterminator